jgi:PEP-CTERM motif
MLMLKVGLLVAVARWRYGACANAMTFALEGSPRRHPIPSRSFLLLAVPLLLAVAGATPARAIGFDCVTGNSASNCEIGEDQLSVTLSSPSPTQVRFDIANAADGVDAVIAGVYFDDDSDLLGSLASIVNGSGVLFEADGSPPVLPGGNTASPAFGVDFSLNAAPAPPKNGIGPGETLGVIFNLPSGVTVQQVEDAFADASLRVGIHVIAFGNEGSESMINVPIPEPSTLVLAALGFMGLAIARRRSRAAPP